MGARDYVANETPVPRGTLTELFFQAVESFPDLVTLRRIRDSEPEGITYRELAERVRNVGAGLRAMGVNRWERVAILSENRPEWFQVDFGCLCAGIPDVPVHSTLTAEQVAYILGDSGARMVFASTGAQMEKALQARRILERDLGIVVFDPPASRPQGVLSWEEFLDRGRIAGEDTPMTLFRERALAVNPDDVATILYTSGTTGDPKGVVLTHNNVSSNVRACAMIIPVGEGDSTLSFLPLSHVFQRMVDYLFFSVGCVITYARSMQTIAQDLRAVRPNKVVSVPRLFERTYQKVLDAKGARARLVQWAREVGEAWAEEKLAGREPSLVLRSVYRVADRLVFRKIREAVGGRMVFFISGSAPLAPEINRFFYSTGLQILEGYGLTETSPVTNVNTLEDFQIGSVGPPIPGTEIRIAQDGEILIRGPQVMREYYNLPEDTAKAIAEDGWFHTGDIGEIDDRGHLRITDRKKNILVTAGGKNVAPAPVENRVKKSPFVDQAVVVGDGRSFLSVLVVPSFERLERWALDHGSTVRSRRELLGEPTVQEFLGKEIFQEVRDLAKFERPRKIGLLADEFTIEGGILTPNQKVKRRVVRARFGGLIEQFYDPANVRRAVFVEEEPTRVNLEET